MSTYPVIGLDELESQFVELLPRRETLTSSVGCVNVGNVVGVNVAIAVNAASIDAHANAIATQYLGLTQ